MQFRLSKHMSFPSVLIGNLYKANLDPRLKHAGMTMLGAKAKYHINHST